MLCFRNPIPHQPFQFTSREFITYSTVRWRNPWIVHVNELNQNRFECTKLDIHLVLFWFIIYLNWTCYVIIDNDCNGLWRLSFVSRNSLKVMGFMTCWWSYQMGLCKVWERIKFARQVLTSIGINISTSLNV